VKPADVHRIADVPIGTDGDESPRRIEGRRRALALPDEERDARERERRADRHERESGQGRPLRQPRLQLRVVAFYDQRQPAHSVKKHAAKNSARIATKRRLMTAPPTVG
jgi:hypothetical protein